MKLTRIIVAAGFAALLGGGLLTTTGNAASVTPAPSPTVDGATQAPSVTPAPTRETTAAPSARATTTSPRSGGVSVRPQGAPETGGGALASIVSTWG